MATYRSVRVAVPIDEHDEASFAALVPVGRRWNGWETPLFNRDEANKVIERQYEIVAALWPPDETAPEDVDLDVLAWAGDDVLVLNPAQGWSGLVRPVLLEGEPHWELGQGWCWEVVG